MNTEGNNKITNMVIEKLQEVEQLHLLSERGVLVSRSQFSASVNNEKLAFPITMTTSFVFEWSSDPISVNHFGAPRFCHLVASSFMVASWLASSDLVSRAFSLVENEYDCSLEFFTTLSFTRQMKFIVQIGYHITFGVYHQACSFLLPNSEELFTYPTHSRINWIADDIYSNLTKSFRANGVVAQLNMALDLRQFLKSIGQEEGKGEK